MKTPSPTSKRMVAALPGGGLLLAIGLALSLASCGKAPGPTVLATVGDRKITVDDFRNEVERRIRARRTLPGKESLLQEMVEYEALAQRARRAGLLEDPQVQREINNLLIGKLQDRDLAARLASVEISDRDVQAEYEKNIAKYTRPAKVRLALLFLEAHSRMSETKRAAIRNRIAEARTKALESVSGKSWTPNDRGAALIGFGPLAIDYSDDQASRYRGGDLGWLEAGNYDHRWPRPVLETGYALPIHQVSEIIETEQGFYLVMQTDSREGYTTPLAEVEAVLKQSLLVGRRQALREAFGRESVRLAQASIDHTALETIELPSPKTLASVSNQQAEPPAFPMATEHGN